MGAWSACWRRGDRASEPTGLPPETPEDRDRVRASSASLRAANLSRVAGGPPGDERGSGVKDIIDAATKDALSVFGGRATEEFQRRLAQGRLCSTRCRACHAVAFPPREFCPDCHGREVEWIELPKEATLYAFTQQQRGLRFLAPDVIGLVEVQGVGHFLSRIDAPFESLAIGMRLAVGFLQIAPGIWVHQYRPARGVPDGPHDP